MTAVFVHGNPETAAVWGPLLAELDRDDVVCLSPPGFGAPLSDGFGATVAEYRDWLVGQVEALGEPVHLVGHDWGGGHVVNLAMTRPDLLLSWTTDIIGVFDPDYVWHPLAQVWQRPERTLVCLAIDIVTSQQKTPRIGLDLDEAQLYVLESLQYFLCVDDLLIVLDKRAYRTVGRDTDDHQKDKARDKSDNEGSANSNCHVC